MSATAMRRQPLHPSIDEATIERLVRRFYGKVKADKELGPIFNEAIGDGWEPHLRKMFDFWSSVMRMTGRYHGKPVPAHRALKALRPDHFPIWLGYFRETAREECEPAAAALFIDRAERIAESLSMAIRPPLESLRNPFASAAN